MAAPSKPIFLLGEARGANEDRIKSAFVGSSGVELIRMLSDASVLTLSQSDWAWLRAYYAKGDPKYIEEIWRAHPEFHRTNVFNLHPPGDKLEHFCGDRREAIPGYPKLGNIGWIHNDYAPELDRLGNEILQHDPNVIVALGNTPIWALTGRTGVSKLRGTTLLSTHCVSDYKLLCVYHPAAVIRQYELRPVTVIDLHKSLRERGFPELRRPSVAIWVEPALDDIRTFIHDHITGCTLLAADIETAGTRVTCISLAPRRDLVLVVPFDDPRQADRSYWRTPEDERRAWSLVRGVLEDPAVPKLFQNGMYDIAFLWRSVGVKVFGAREDTMLLSHALQPESLKGLGYLGSVYAGDHGAWKTQRKDNETIKRDA